MADYRFTIQNRPDARDVEALGQGLTEHSLPTTGRPGFEPFAVFAHDADAGSVNLRRRNVQVTFEIFDSPKMIYQPR